MKSAFSEDSLFASVGGLGSQPKYRSVGLGIDDDTESVVSIGDSVSGRRGRHLIFGKAWSRSVKWLKARKKGQRPARLVDRDGHFHQSFGRWNIRRLRGQADLKKLVGSDPFHSLVNQTTSKIIFGILGMYLGIIVIFAVIYRVISMTLGCALELVSMREAFLFSLETMSTVGYGTNDYLFDHCWSMLPVLFLQASIGLLIDAFLIGILFVRLSRPQTRASTVVFSNHAVIRRVRGEAYFMFQVGELRKHQLLETRVRCYALRHERLTSRTVEECKRAATAAAATAATGLSPMNGPTPSMNNLDISRAGSTSEELAANQPEQVSFQSHSMRLQHPDDEIGGNLLLVTPQSVVHRIDAWSPMMPPPRWNSSNGMVTWGFHQDKAVPKAPWHEPDEDWSPEANGKVDAEGYGGAASIGRNGRIGRNGSIGFEGSMGGGFGNVSGAGGDSKDGLAGLAEAREANQRSKDSASPDESPGRQGDEGAEGADRRDSLYSNYWEESAYSEFGNNQERDPRTAVDTVGYVHRFPDLQKRWDDVDGERGTWYEAMKRRLLKAEKERRALESKTRQEQQRRLRKAMEEPYSPARASANRLSRAGFRRPDTKRRASIMHIDGAPDLEESLLPRDKLYGDSGGKRSKEPPLERVVEVDHPADSESGRCRVGTAASMAGPGVPAPTLTPSQWFAKEERKAINAYIQDRELEVVVILEGTDTSTGSTVQARHSYCWEDILWDRTFACCVTRGEDGACETDFSKFHTTLEAPKDCIDFGFVQSFA